MRSEKKSIHLTEDQRGPFPVSVESLWFDEARGGWQLKNVPFFVDGIAFDDVVRLVSCGSDDFLIDAVLYESGNSTVWLYFTDAAQAWRIEALKAIGCGVEGGVFEGYFAVNVPAQVGWDCVAEVLKNLAATAEVSIDYPCIRAGHGKVAD